MKMKEYVMALPLDVQTREELQEKITRDRYIFYWCGLCVGVIGVTIAWACGCFA